MTALAAVLFLAAGALPTSVNLAPDPGFERPVTAWPLPQGFAIDAATAHGVARSLRRDVGPGTPYTLSVIDLPLRPGEAALVRVWARSRGLVRVADVPGWEGGASWFAEFWDGVTYRGGQYPQGVRGDTDWTLLEGVLRVPADLPPTTRVIFGLYTRQGLEGTAWFDDVEIFRSLLQPVGFEDGPAPFTVNAEWFHDTTRGWRGTASLRADRPHPGTACRWGEANYLPIAAPVALEPGRAYRGIVFVETPGLAIGLPCQQWGPPVGASLFFESYDAGGAYLTGRYPVLMAHYDKDLIALFEGRAADLYGTDIYPIPGNVPAYGSSDPCIGPSPLRRAGEMLAAAQSATLGRGVPLIISQLHGLWNHPDLLPCGWGGAPRDERRAAFPAPTREQATYLFFDGLARGAKGALGYSLFDVAEEDRLYDPVKLLRLRRPAEGALVDLTTGSVVPRIFGRVLMQLGSERAMVLHYRAGLVP